MLAYFVVGKELSHIECALALQKDQNECLQMILCELKGIRCDIAALAER